MKKLYLIVVASLALSACGGTSQDFSLISLKIENSRAPEGFAALTTQLPSSRLTVTRFKLTVSGEGISSPIIAEADGSATEVEVLEIPPGVNRSLLIQAFNSDGEVIRRRQIDGLNLNPGVITPIHTSLNTIPLILNLRNGNVVQANSLRLQCFGEPGSSLSITAEASNGTSISLNESVSDPILVSPSVSTGLADYIPPTSLRGRQKLEVRDSQSGESSSVTVLIIDSNRPGTRLSAAGGSNPSTSLNPGFGGRKSVQFPKIILNQGGKQ
ncbi:MAG: hypothetical protein IPJ69_03615 [Deltaproteobacteria bacterium]|nr:MAG: hypothetical protein IPJ69_03615 [Deltaproteobacteria bacterium]